LVCCILDRVRYRYVNWAVFSTNIVEPWHGHAAGIDSQTGRHPLSVCILASIESTCLSNVEQLQSSTLTCVDVDCLEVATYVKPATTKPRVGRSMAQNDAKPKSRLTTDTAISLEKCTLHDRASMQVDAVKNPHRTSTRVSIGIGIPGPDKSL
jgi:hypothetical protein